MDSRPPEARTVEAQLLSQSAAKRELRKLVSYRRSLVQERSREANRIQEMLNGGNIKLG